MNTRNREIQTEQVRNQTVNGLFVAAYLIGGNNPTSANVNFENVNVKIVLNRNGMQDIILQDDLKTLGTASTLDSLSQYAFDGTGKTVGSGLGSLVQYWIPFGGHINLKGDDYLFVEVNSQKDVYSDDIANSSYLFTKLTKSVGYETHTPFVHSRAVQAAETSRKFDLGDFVTRVAIINYDKTAFTDNVIDNVTVTSDRYNDNLTYAELVHLKISKYQKQLLPVAADLAANMVQDQSFLLFDFHQQFNGLELDVKFNSNRVAQGQNKVVWWTMKPTPQQLQKAATMADKHANEASAKITSEAKK